MPAIHSRSSVTARPTREGLSSALLIRAGVDPVANRWRATDDGYRRDVPTSEMHRAADEGQRLAGLSFREILREAARYDWHDVPDDDSKIFGYLARHCATQEAARAFTTQTAGGLVEDLVRTLFLTELAEAVDSTQGMVQEVEVPDTRPARLAKMGISAALSPMVRGTDAEPLPLSGDTEGYNEIRVMSFANQLAIDEQDLMDWDDQVIAAYVRQLATAARAVRRDLVFYTWLANATQGDGTAIFDASRSNLLTSAGLDATKLGAAMAAFRKQAYATRPLNEAATYLLVPSALEATAQRLVRDLDAPGSKPPIVRTDARLDLGVSHPWTKATASGSATSWYLVAPRATAFATLKGLRSPQLNTWFMSNGRFGLGAACRWYAGCAMADPAAIQRNDA